MWQLKFKMAAGGYIYSCKIFGFNIKPEAIVGPIVILGARCVVNL